MDPNSYFAIIAYSVTSTTSVSKACDSVLRRSIALSPISRVSQNGTVLGEDQQSTALLSVISSLGLKGCSPAVSSTLQSLNVSTGPSGSTVTSPALLSLPSPSSLSSLLSLSSAPLLSSPTTSSHLSSSLSIPVSSGLNGQGKIVVGVVVPFAVIGLLLIIPVSWRRYRTRKQIETVNDAALPQDIQPYLQQKPELEAEERERYEMEAQDARHEMQGEDAIHEIGLERDQRPVLRLQELKGSEPSKELEVPNNLS